VKSALKPVHRLADEKTMEGLSKLAEKAGIELLMSGRLKLSAGMMIIDIVLTELRKVLAAHPAKVVDAAPTPTAPAQGAVAP
jgi:hypothetical protein